MAIRGCTLESTEAYRQAFWFGMRARPESTKVSINPVNKKRAISAHPRKNKEDTGTAAL